MPFRYAIAPRKIALILGFIALFLAAQSLYTEYLVETYQGTDSTSVLGPILDLFSVNLEQSIPTWYSALLLSIAGALLAVIAVAKWTQRDGYKIHWTGLALIFFYLSMDESAVIHEIFSDPLLTLFHTTGYLAFGWQIVAAPLVILFALMYLRFLLHLPARTRNLILLAGGLYVGGALVVDAISANEWVQDNGITLIYLAIGTLEELMEMQGVVVFIFALLRYLVSMNYAVTFFSASGALQNQESAVAASPAQSDSQSASSGTPARSKGALWRVAQAIAAILILMNVVFLYWARTEPTPVPIPSQDSVLAYQAILAQPGGDQVTVTRVAGMFGMDQMVSRRVAAANLTLFDQVMVVALPGAETSLILSGATLPFDRTTLTDILRANKVTQFIVFDTPAVRQMTLNP